MIDPLDDTQRWFETAFPDGVPSKIQHTQLGVHFEEVSEMIEALKGRDRLTQSMLTAAYIALHGLALHLKATDETVEVTDDVKLFDAVLDQVVTSVGVGFGRGYPMSDGLDEVNNSNFSKFVDGKPVFDVNMKIIKGPDYVKADLRRILVATLGDAGE